MSVSLDKPAVAGHNNRWRSRIVRRDWANPSDFLINPQNYRAHPDRQRAALVGVLAKTGWVDDVKVQQGTDLIIDGHMRCAEAILAGELVPVTWLDLSDEEAEEMLAFFDPIGSMADQDEEKYRALVAGALTMEESLRAALIDLDEIARKQIKDDRRARRGDAEATPDPPEQPSVSAGEIWILGDHVLAVGDCNDLALVTRAQEALGVTGAMLCVTDPPYNAGYVSRVDHGRIHPFGPILGDSLPEDEYGAFLYDTLVTIQALLQPGGSVYICIDDDHYAELETLFKQHFTKQGLIVWDKEHFGMGNFYRHQHELILFGTAGQRSSRWNAGHSERNVWSIKRDPSGSYRHPTQKPVAMMERAITNSSVEGDVVIDLFGGSGSTLIACESLDRRCLMVELSERWAEVIIRRWQNYADDEAIRLGDDVSFNDLIVDHV